MEKMSLTEAVMVIKQKLPHLTQTEIENGFDLNISLTDEPFFVNVSPSEVKFFMNTSESLELLQQQLLN